MEYGVCKENNGGVREPHQAGVPDGLKFYWKAPKDRDLAAVIITGLLQKGNSGLLVAERKNGSTINPEICPDHGSILPEPLDHSGAVGRGTTQRTSFGLVAGSFLDALFGGGG